MSDIRHHLASRHVQDFSGIVCGAGCCYFLLWTLTGALAGVQKYNPDGGKENRGLLRKWAPNGKHPSLRYLTYVREGMIGVWGLHSLRDDAPCVFLTEGVFDAISIHNCGYPAIAVLTNNPASCKQWLSLLPQRRIAILDNDNAGRSLAKYAHQAHFLPGYKDLNAAPPEVVKRFLDDILRHSAE